MSGSDPHVHQTLEFRTATAIARLLPTGLLLIFLALALIILADAERNPPANQIGVALCLILGSGLIGLALWRRSNPGKPLFTLSPAGIRYRIAWVKEFLIPWTEVQGVDTIDIIANMPWYLWLIAPSNYSMPIFRDVAVVLVSKQFYDSQIFVDSAFLRGPGWNNNFIPKDSLVQVALHHELVSVESRTLREAVEARWRAFRDKPAVEPFARAPKSDIVAMGDDQRSISRWEAVQIIVLLLGVAGALANLAGLWELPGQSEARMARAEARKESEYWTESMKRRADETKRREAREKERQRDFEETMKRAFGP